MVANQPHNTLVAAAPVAVQNPPLIAAAPVAVQNPPLIAAAAPVAVQNPPQKIPMAMRDLPKDLVEEEILSYVPATYLKRLKTTCKRWYSLYGDSNLARNHIRKAEKQFLVLMLNNSRIGPISLNVHNSRIGPLVEFKREFTIVDPKDPSAQFEIDRAYNCEGLLTCTSHDGSRFLVWNPFTGETRWFDGIENSYSVLGYYEEKKEKFYKILLFSKEGVSKIYEFRTASWRTLGGDIVSPRSKVGLIGFTVSFKGNACWFADCGTKPHHKTYMLRFDFKTEKFVHVPLPYQSRSYYCFGLSVVREEKLAVLLQHNGKSKTEIWVTKKIDETPVWSKVLAFDSPDDYVFHTVSFILNEDKKCVTVCDSVIRSDDTKRIDMIYSFRGDEGAAQVENFGEHSAVDGYRWPFGWPFLLNYAPSLVKIEELGGQTKKASASVKSFSFNELELATRNFRPDSVVGEGVFRGWLNETTLSPTKSSSSLVIAVRRLNPNGFQGRREWLTESNYLGQLRHPNLVKLIGYYLEDEKRLLVYEFMHNGSLENHLFSRNRDFKPLSWILRIKVALDAAKGLAFLHSDPVKVIYRDIKASNILLDSDFNAKLSNFGLTRDGPMGKTSSVSRRVMSTLGYAAPEYVSTGHLNARSDVYSFWVVLLELLCGRQALDHTRPAKEQKLVGWARPYLTSTRDVILIVDARINSQVKPEEAMTLANIALRCLSFNQRSRPTMDKVVRALEAVI